MANPTAKWDTVPVYGWYFELDGVTPKTGKVLLNLNQRVNSKDGRNIFPGGTVTVTLGGTDNDTAAMNQVRSAMRIVDQAAVEAGGGTFDAAAWDADWDARVPAAFFTSFPASDDPDIVQGGYKVTVTEKLNGDPGGKVYQIQPLLSMLDTPIPGLNVGTVDVPPGAPTAPAPIYQKGAPGGVAPLDSDAKVPLENLPDNIGGGGSATWGTIAGQPAVIAAGDTQQAALDAVGAASAASVTAVSTEVTSKADEADLIAHTSATNNPHAVTAGQVGLGSVNNTADVDKPVSTAQAAALAAKADLDGSGKVSAAQLPSYVDDVLEFANSTAFPQTGESGKIYIALDTRYEWRWSGSTYVQLVSSPGSTDAVPEGTVNKYYTDARAQAAVTRSTLGISNVDNTSDVNKPVSTAQATALAGKEPVIAAGSSAQFRRGDKTWQTLNAAAIIDATTPGKALMTAADVNSVRAVSNIYELGATDSPSTLGLPAGSWILRLPVPTLVEPTRDGFNYQNGVPASGQVVTATADSTLVAGSWMVAVYTGNGAMGTVVAPSGWSAVMPRTTVGTLDMCVYAKIADSTDASSKSFAFSSGANSANSSLMLLWGSGAAAVANWIIGTVENRATAGGAFANIAPSVTTTKDKTLVLALSGERTAAVDSTAPTVTGATAWVNGPESQTLQLQTTEVAYIDKTTAGATGNVTITYPNTHTTNGLALQIAIPAP